MKDFFAPYVEFWKRYVDFGGRTSRRNYWMVVLIEVIISVIFSIFYIINAGLGNTLEGIYSLATLIPGLAICVRRLHDTNRSGLNLLWLLLPLVGWIILIVYLAQPSVD